MTKLSKANKHKSSKTDIDINLTNEYQKLFKKSKEKDKVFIGIGAQTRNQLVIELYWHIGKQIIKKQRDANWGDGLI